MPSKITELKKRWDAPTPEFWKTWIKYLTIIVGMAASALVTITTLNFEVPALMIQILQGIIIVGAACGVQAKLTKP